MPGRLNNTQFVSPIWLPEGQIQTILGSRIARYPTIRFSRERLTTADGDFIDLDWNIPGLDSVSQVHQTFTERPFMATSAHADLALSSTEANFNGSALVLFHGLEGSSESNYAQSICHDFRSLGWAVVVAHFRGCSGEENRLVRSYYSGDTADVDFIVQHIHRRLPQANWHAVGVSMGGNVLLKYVGDRGADLAHLQAVASISTPTDLYAAGMHLGNNFFGRYIYTPYFLNTMKKKIVHKDKLFPGVLDTERILAAKSLYDFDDAYTGPVHGFSGAESYWMLCSAKPGLINIQIPCLMINAKNDPFVPANSLPTVAEVSSYVTLLQPKDGGHCSFTRGHFPSHFGWISDRLHDFFCSKDTQHN